jgi:hypothetical protein
LYSFYWELAVVSILFLIAFTYALNVSIISIFDANLIFFSFDPTLLRRILVGLWLPEIEGLDIAVKWAFYNYKLIPWELVEVIDVLLSWLCSIFYPFCALLVEPTTEGLLLFIWSCLIDKDYCWLDEDWIELVFIFEEKVVELKLPLDWNLGETGTFELEDDLILDLYCCQA